MKNDRLEGLEALGLACNCGDLYGVRLLLQDKNLLPLSGEEQQSLVDTMQCDQNTYVAEMFAAFLQAGQVLPAPLARQSIDALRAALHPSRRVYLDVFEEHKQRSIPFMPSADTVLPALRTSYYGGLPFSLPQEDWPEYEGVPMNFIAHFWLADVPHRPEVLADVAALSLFMHHEDDDFGRHNGESWCMRAYTQPEVERLRRWPKERPQDKLSSCWRLVWQPPHAEVPECDHPVVRESVEAAYHVAPDDDGSEMEYFREICWRQGPHPYSKLGGYPNTIQDGDVPHYVLQLSGIFRLGLELGFGYDNRHYFCCRRCADGQLVWTMDTQMT